MNASNTCCTRKWNTLARIFLIAVPLLTFGVVVNFDFVRWDDDINILNNPHVASLGFAEVAWMFTDVEWAHRYLPLGWMTYAVERSLWGADPFMFHLGNLAWHIVNGLLLFGIVKRILHLAGGGNGEPGPGVIAPAALAALLWMINPLRAEVVSWSSARIYLMATFWFFLAVTFYLDTSDSATRRRRWAILFYALSLLTYPVAMLAGPVFILLDWLVLNRLPRRVMEWSQASYRGVWIEKLPFVGLSVAWLMLMVLTRNQGRDVGYVDTLQVFDIPHRLAQGLWGLVYYLTKPWWPTNLAPQYGNLYQFEVGEGRFLAAVVIVVGITAFCVTRKRPVYLALWGAHLLFFVPFIGLTEYPHSFYDRYSYAAGGLMAVLVGMALWKAWPQSTARWGSTVAAVAAVGVFMVMSSRQTLIWQNTATVRLRVAESLGHPELRAQHEQVAGQYFMDQKDPAQALECYEQAWTHDPADVDYRLDMGDALVALEREEEALAIFREVAALPAVEIRPRLHLGVSLCKLGRLEEGAAAFQKILEENPDHEKARHNLDLALEHIRKSKPALEPVSFPQP